MSPIPHGAFINCIAWLLMIGGAISFAASTARVIYCLFARGVTSTEVTSHLHDTYYVIRHSRFIIWPFLLCMSLSAAIAIMGYMCTSLHMNRLMRTPVSSTAQV